MVDFIKLKDVDKDSEITKPKKRKTQQISIKKILITIALILLISSLISSLYVSMSPKIGVVPIKGPIMTVKGASLSGTYVSSREISEIIYDLEKDDTIKAILIDLNSPGGTPVAAEEISNAINQAKKTKPVYVVINDIGASGGFWIAMSADKIYSSSMSTIGSIGVTSAGLSFENFIANYNISYRKQTAGNYKDMGSAFREPTNIEKEKIQNILDEIHLSFITHIAENRNMSHEEVEKYATGEIFLGSTGYQAGFIDEIGDYKNAIDDLQNITNGDLLVIKYEPYVTFSETLGLNSLFQFSTKSQNIVMLE